MCRFDEQVRVIEMPEEDTEEDGEDEEARVYDLQNSVHFIDRTF